jgi:hypothetical protein
MGRDYREALRRRGIELGPTGRPRVPPAADQLRDGWRRATQAEKAAFLCETGVWDQPRCPEPVQERAAAEVETGERR